ncbi:MAG TPA: phosphate ABC transporter substrate-binding protein [Candidatus Tectomicrobia bacterium]|jgi:phosphate transport system substrate-binding protein
MIKSTAVAFAFVLSLLAGSAAAQIAYVGSSTLGEHIIPEAARAFAAKTGIPFGRIELQGSGEGLEMVLRGEAPLAGVARSLTLEEKQRRPYYRIVGYDAIGIYVHPTNPVTSLTRPQLKAIYTGRITNWHEVGGADAPIVCITQRWGARQAQMLEVQEFLMAGAPYREDRQEVDRQPDMADALLTEPYGITALSQSFARPGIKAIAIDGFTPEPRHIRSGGYLLSRPLLLVSSAHPPGAVTQFIDFLLGPEGQEIVARKFVPVR